MVKDKEKQGPFCEIRSSRAYKAAIAVAVVLLLLCITRVIAVMHQSENKVGVSSPLTELDRSTNIDENWTLHNLDGSTESVSLPLTCLADDDGGLVISTKLEDIDYQHACIKLGQNRYGIKAYIDDELIYQVNTTKISRQLMFSTISLIELPDNSSGHELKLVFSGTKDGKYRIPGASRDSIGAFRYSVALGDIYTLIVIVLMIALGIVLLTTHFIYQMRGYEEPRLVCLAEFLFLSATWGFCDSWLPLLIGMSSELSGILCYSALATLMIPMTIFIWMTCGKRGRILPVMAIIGIINVFAQVALSITGIVKLDSMIAISHSIIFICIGIGFIELAKAFSENTDSKDLAMTFYGGIMLASSSIVTLILYWLKEGSAYRNCLMTGMLCFMLMFFIGVVIKHNETREAEREKLKEAELNKFLSNYDQLTGLRNRRAFESRLSEIEEKDMSLDTAMVMMDLNDLKVTNDTYGHGAGDDLIATAARVIEEVYGRDGECYRIGGDEFVVIVTNPRSGMSTYDELLDQRIEERNKLSKWKLSIARGFSYLYKTDGTKRSIEEWKMESDAQMYKNKGGHNRA